jgi:hypothetical protein
MMTIFGRLGAAGAAAEFARTLMDNAINATGRNTTIRTIRQLQVGSIRPQKFRAYFSLRIFFHGGGRGDSLPRRLATDYHIGMNKAFVREPDSTIEHCPRCGSVGEPVGAATLDALLKPDCREKLGESASFCPAPTCDVAYFDEFERSAGVNDLQRPVYPKDPAAPICACFGYTCDEIEEEARTASVVRVRAAIERTKSDEARCSQMAANGRSCVAEIQRYYLKCRAQQS